MILGTVVILCCIFLQNVTAKLAIWDSFDWKITLQRQQQDEMTIRGLVEAGNTGIALPQDVKIPGATCEESKEWTEETGFPGFIMQCKCNLGSSTFAPELMSCVANRKIKRGCQFTTGSWRWRTSWTWDTVDDTLIMLDNKHDYGIATGLNVSTMDYQSCSVESLHYWAEDMNWAKASYFFNYSKPVMFKLHNMWHLLWNVANLKTNVNDSLEGKILKFQIECEKPGPPQNEDEELEITSCFLVKVTGEFNITSKNWDSRNTTEEVTTVVAKTSSKSDKDKLLFSILIPLGLIVIITCAVIVVCHIKRVACFAQSREVHHVTVLDDDVVESKLIQNPPDESAV